jgi:hypothetical protein
MIEGQIARIAAPLLSPSSFRQLTLRFKRVALNLGTINEDAAWSRCR